MILPSNRRVFNAINHYAESTDAINLAFNAYVANFNNSEQDSERETNSFLAKCLLVGKKVDTKLEPLALSFFELCKKSKFSSQAMPVMMQSPSLSLRIMNAPQLMNDQLKAFFEATISTSGIFSLVYSFQTKHLFNPGFAAISNWFLDQNKRDGYIQECFSTTLTEYTKLTGYEHSPWLSAVLKNNHERISRDFALTYAKDIIKGKCEDIEEYLNTSQYMAYVSLNKLERSEYIETSFLRHLAQDEADIQLHEKQEILTQSLVYANATIKGRWPELESHIEDHVKRFAINTSKNFNEKTIKLIQAYYKDHYKKRWFELESILINHSTHKHIRQEQLSLLRTAYLIAKECGGNTNKIEHKFLSYPSSLNGKDDAIYSSLLSMSDEDTKNNIENLILQVAKNVKWEPIIDTASLIIDHCKNIKKRAPTIELAIAIELYKKNISETFPIEMIEAYTNKIKQRSAIIEQTMIMFRPDMIPEYSSMLEIDPNTISKNNNTYIEVISTIRALKHANNYNEKIYDALEQGDYASLKKIHEDYCNPALPEEKNLRTFIDNMFQHCDTADITLDNYLLSIEQRNKPKPAAKMRFG